MSEPIISMVTVITGTLSAACFRSSIALAAARDAGEQIGKSLGLGPKFVASKCAVSPGLFTGFCLLTVSRCRAHGLGEPVGQSAVSWVQFQLVVAHALE